MLSEIYVKAGKVHDLREFQALFCSTMGVASAEERYSENRAGGVYYRAQALGISVVIEEADDDQLPDYAFSITFEVRLGGGAGVADGLADSVASELTLLGHNVLRVSTAQDNPSRRIKRRCTLDQNGSPRFIEEP